MTLSSQQLAAQINGDVHGDRSVMIGGVSSVSATVAGTVTYAETPGQLRQAVGSDVSAVIAPARLAEGMTIPPFKAVIGVKNPRVAFARTLRLFYPVRVFERGVHQTAVIGEGVRLVGSAHVGANAVVKSGASIGARSVVDSGSVVGEGALIGEDCVIHPRVTLYPGTVLGNRVIIHSGAVIGSDGFGYVTDAGEHMKIPQVGNVVIEDDVEIGANTTIDRATLGSTLIRRGAKIDNLVQIAHNNTIGEHCLIAAQAGLAGSVTLGRYVMLGGQVGIADHKKIGDQAMVGGQGGVIGDLPAKSVVWGTPAQPNREWLRQLSALRRLPEIIKELVAKGILGPVPHGQGQDGQEPIAKS